MNTARSTLSSALTLAFLVGTTSICPGQWMQVATSSPPISTIRHAGVFDEARGNFVIYGNIVTQETWGYDGIGWSLLQAGSGAPGSRVNGAMVYDHARSRCLMWGGNLPVTRSPDLWEWNGNTWRIINTIGPRPTCLAFCGLAYDIIRDRVVLYSGVETWEFDGQDWARLSPLFSGPPPGLLYADAQLAYDSRREVCVLVGVRAVIGSTACQCMETWEWDGVTWTHVDTEHAPAARDRHAMIYDSASGYVVLHGGTNSRTRTTFGDTWLYDGLDWIEMTSAGPLPREDHVLGFDPVREVVICHGGLRSPSQIATAETWELSVVVPASYASFGAECSVAQPPQLSVRSPFRVGSQFSVELANIPSSVNAAFLLVGFERWDPVVALDHVGMPGCALAVRSSAVAQLSATAGSAFWQGATPLTSNLLGLSVYHQGIVPALTANPAGVLTSRGARALIGM